MQLRAVDRHHLLDFRLEPAALQLLARLPPSRRKGFAQMSDHLSRVDRLDGRNLGAGELRVQTCGERGR
jgi:hypothetical protein